MEITKNGEQIADIIFPHNSDACVHVDPNGDTRIECLCLGSDIFEIRMTDAEVTQLYLLLNQRERKKSKLRGASVLAPSDYTDINLTHALKISDPANNLAGYGRIEWRDMEIDPFRGEPRMIWTDNGDRTSILRHTDQQNTVEDLKRSGAIEFTPVELPEYTPDWETLSFDYVRQDADGHVCSFEAAPEYKESLALWSGRGNHSRYIGQFRPPVDAKLAAWDRPGK